MNMITDTLDNIRDYVVNNIQDYFIKNADNADILAEADERGFIPQSRGNFDAISELIVPIPSKLNNQTLAIWKQAIAAAENADNPNRFLLYQLYDNVMIDLHLSAVIESRILPVQRARFKITDDKTGEINKELTKALDKNWFEDIIKYAIESRFYGYSLAELNEFHNQIKAYVKLVKRENVCPEKGFVRIEPGDDKGISYEGNELEVFYIGIGNKTDLGLLKKLTPLVLAKKYALGQWSEYNEKLGIPFRSVRTPSRDKKRHAKLAQIMENMGSAGWAVLNENELIEFLETNKDSGYNAFDKLIDRIDNYISKLILGQTGTTDNNSNGTYGSLRILADVAEDRHETDKVFYRRLANDQLAPRLIAFGFPMEGHSLVWDDTIELSATEKIDLINKVNINYVVNPEYVTEQTGIPIEGERKTNTFE